MLRHGQAVARLAFFAAAMLATLLAAQTQLACTRQIVLRSQGSSMPGMPGMSDMGATMPMVPGIALCPIVLVLAVAAGLLTVAAAALMLRSGDGRFARHSLVRSCAALPLGSGSGLILALGSAAVGAMMTVDGTAPAGAPGWAALVAIIVATALGLAVITRITGLLALAFAHALVRSIERGHRIVRPGIRVLRGSLHEVVPRPRSGLAPLATRAGLRAPPAPVR